MITRRFLSYGALFGLFFLLLLAPSIARAQAPETVEVFVYGINAKVPGAVYGTFAPPSVDTIYLLADQTSILSPRRTGVYYWPISNEYRAAWSLLNETVPGDLEVLQGGQVIETLAQQPYTIHFSQGAGPARPQLYVGDEAALAEAQFLASKAAYEQASRDYQQAREEWIAAGREAQEQGLDRSTIPPMPEPPPAFNLFSTGINAGFAVDFPAGEYKIRLRQPDGTIAEGSERDLRMIESRSTAVGYEVVPENRWTFPESLNALEDAILVAQDSVIYLKPRLIREYPALAYERLQNPQYVGDGDENKWDWIGDETDTTLEEGVLEVVRNGQVVDRIERESYSVKQAPGKEYGYEILPFNPDTPDLTPRADFAGFKLESPADRDSFEVQFVSLEGEPFVGSVRQVRVTPEVSLAPLLFIGLLPVILGAALLYWRRRSTRLNRETSGAG